MFEISGTIFDDRQWRQEVSEAFLRFLASNGNFEILKS